MATENSLTSSAAFSLASAINTLALDTDLADFTVTCGDKEWKLHSAILAARSPFFKAAITNNMAEKLEMKIDIKEFDPETMEEVINFMYGKPIENAPINFLFEAAERFQMNDLKKDVVKLAKQKMAVDNVVEFAQLAEMYDVGGFLGECADFIVKKKIYMKEELSPKLSKLVFGILDKNFEDAKAEASRNLQAAKTEAWRDLQAVKTEASRNLQAARTETNKICDNLFKANQEVARLKGKLVKLVEPTCIGNCEPPLYGCTKCKVIFSSRPEAVNHMIEHH